MRSNGVGMPAGGESGRDNRVAASTPPHPVGLHLHHANGVLTPAASPISTSKLFKFFEPLSLNGHFFKKKKRVNYTFGPCGSHLLPTVIPISK